MTCKNCGAQMPPEGDFCTNCGCKNTGNESTVFCTNCGSPIAAGAGFCTNCGAAVGSTNATPRCANCGVELAAGVAFCPNCGNPVKSAAANQPAAAPIPGEAKSKLAAGLLGIFLGWIGVHNFYLGYTKKAVIQLLLGTVGSCLCGLGPVASGIWGLVEGIMILAGSIKVDGKGNLLGE